MASNQSLYSQLVHSMTYLRGKLKAAESDPDIIAVVKMSHLRRLVEAYDAQHQHYEAADTVTFPITRCARCGQDHPGIVFRPFIVAGPEEVTHWGLCPATAEPLLLAIQSIPPLTVEPAPYGQQETGD